VNDPVRVALVGAGGIAQTHALAAAGVTEVTVVAVVDPDVSAARALGEQLGCPAFASVEEVSDASLVDLAIVATPPSTHVDVACTLLHAGVGVLCEKPLALTSAHAARLAECARASGALLTMASKYRFATDVVRAKGLLASGSLGEVVRLENAFAARVGMGGRWNSDAAISGGGVLIDNGTHSVDIARFLLGPVTEVLAVPTPQVQGLPVEDGCVLLLRHGSGSLTSVELSWSTDRLTDRYIAVVGTQGTLEVGWRSSQLRTAGSPGPVEFGVGWDKVQALGANLVNVAHALRGQEELVVGIDDAIASVQVIETAYASLRAGGAWLPVPSSPDVISAA